MDTSLDHLLWGVPELEAGRRAVAERTGVLAAVGGRHPGVGTHNALLDLGSDRYLELIAPDPSHDRLTGFGRHLAGIADPRLVTWCARGDDLEAVAAAARSAGMTAGKVIGMSRRRPDGTLLEWRLLQLDDDEGGLLPFFIEWGGTEHPSRSAPGGCRLVRFTLHHPSPADLRRRLRALGLDPAGPAVTVEAAPAPHLSALLDTPRGRVELAGAPDPHPRSSRP
jgi:hypothetical protein